MKFDNNTSLSKAKEMIVKKQLANLFATRHSGKIFSIPHNSEQCIVRYNHYVGFYIGCSFKLPCTHWNKDFTESSDVPPNYFGSGDNDDFYQAIINQGGGVIALGRNRKVFIGDRDYMNQCAAGDGFCDITTATPGEISRVVAAVQADKENKDQ